MNVVWLPIMQSIMGNSDSVMVQKRMARFRPEERSVIDGAFERLQAGGPGKTLQLEALQVRGG